jgi:hypothetical protein
VANPGWLPRVIALYLIVFPIVLIGKVIVAMLCEKEILRPPLYRQLNSGLNVHEEKHQKWEYLKNKNLTIAFSIL